MTKIMSWFKSNSMAANPAKFQLMFLGINDNKRLCLDINNNIVVGCNSVKLLGVTIDHRLSFFPHVEQICNKANQKTKALLRIRNYLSFKQARLLFNAHIISAFSYCPLIGMFCGKSGDGLINKTHCRALRAVHQNFELSLSELLIQEKSDRVHEEIFVVL